jgi:hypothetical protein
MVEIFSLNPGVSHSFLDLNLIGPDKWWVYPLFFVAFVFYCITFLLPSRRYQGIAFWTGTLAAFSAVFLLSIRLIDEVFVNLEHVYNWYHFGRYSFSPVAVVDGTVEWLYYALLYPFAATRYSLILSAVGLAFVIGFLHVIVLNRIVGRSYLHKAIGVFVFLIMYPVMLSLSSGFGGGLVSLLFLLGVMLSLEGKLVTALTVVSAAALCRPEAVIWTGPFIVLLLQKQGLKALRYTVIPLAFVATYFGVFYSFFSYFLPFPMQFKMMKSSGLGLSLSFVKQGVGGFLHHILLAIWVSLSLLISVAFLAIKWPDRRRYLFSRTALMYAVTFAIATLLTVRGMMAARYILPFYLLHCVVLAKMIITLWEKRDAVFVSLKWGVGSRFLVLCLVFYLGVHGVFVQKMDYGFRGYQSFLKSKSFSNESLVAKRLTLFGWVGQFLGKLDINELKMAAREVHTQGFMNDGNYLDMWGYTDPQTAHVRAVLKQDPVAYYINKQAFDVFFMDEVFYLFRENHFSKQTLPYSVDVLDIVQHIRQEYSGYSFDGYHMMFINFHPKYPQLYLPFLVKASARETFVAALHRYGAYRDASMTDYETAIETMLK